MTVTPVRTEEPEIIGGTAASALPAGSVVMRCDVNGEPLAGLAAFTIGVNSPTNGLQATNAYLVLLRAPEPPAVVGEVIRTDTRLALLGLGAVVWELGDAFPAGEERRTVGVKVGSGKPSSGGSWMFAGSGGYREPRLPVHVLALGEPEGVSPAF